MLNIKNRTISFFSGFDKESSGFNLFFLMLSVLSGVLLSLSFQKFNIAILIWVCLVPLLYCILNSKIIFALLYAFITGFVFNVISICWMLSFLEFNTDSFVSSLILSCVVWVYLAAYFALWAGMLNFVKRYLTNVKLILFSAALWVSLEYARTYILSGFPLNLLAYSQSVFYPIIQIADITGVYGVSFVIVSVNFLFYFYLKSRNKNYLVCLLIIISVLLSYGLVRVNKFSGDYGDKKIKVGVVQPNIEQNKKWRSGYAVAIMNILRTNANYFVGKNVDMIVYPETVLPRKLEENKDVKKIMQEVSRFAKLTLVGGMSDEGKKKYNSVFILSQYGEIIGKYKKRHLVIFGEYLPFKRLLPKFFESLYSLNLTGELSGEKELTTFKFGEIVLGINICSERYYPDLSRNLALKGANVLTNHTNDAWFFDMATPYQNFVMNVFRAVETRKNLIVAANTGISAIISPSGKCVVKTKVNENKSFIGDVYTNHYISPYVRMGDMFVYLCMIFSAWSLLFCIFKKYKLNRKEKTLNRL